MRKVEQLIEFEWVRCLTGYKIVATNPARKRPAWTHGKRVVTPPRWTVDGAPNAALASAGTRFELYCPTEFPALFQRFADMPATAEGMRDFANRFGLLETPGNSRLSASITYEATVVGDVLAHHAALRWAVDLFGAGDSPGLAQYYNAGWGQLRTQLRPQPDGKVTFVFMPSSLIQFLWIQFALHAASNAKLLRCERCGTPFRVGTGTRRRDTAKFCSNACKVAAFRARHAGHA